MKFFVITFLLLISFCFARGPKTYSVARTDKATTQLPSPMPDWGGATGVGKKWCNPAFNKLCMIRLSDVTTSYPTQSLSTSIFTADSGELHLFSSNEK